QNSLPELRVTQTTERHPERRVSDRTAQHGQEHVEVLKRQANRNHRQRGEYGASQMMMPGGLTPFACETPIARQDQTQADQNHSKRRARKPQSQAEQGNQGNDSNRASHERAHADRLAIESDQRRLIKVRQNQKWCSPDADRQQRTGTGISRRQNEVDERIG